MRAPCLVVTLAAVTLAIVPTASADLVSDAQARFRELPSYRVTLRSLAADGERQIIVSSYRRPGWVRLDFVEPHAGAVLVYDPERRRARLSPFGEGRFPALDLAPDNPLIRSAGGHTVDRSDVGALLANLAQLRVDGTMTNPVPASVAERAAWHFEITGPEGRSIDRVRRYRVWMEQESLFPLKVDSFDSRLELLESVDMSDARLDVEFPDGFFGP